MTANRMEWRIRRARRAIEEYAWSPRPWARGAPRRRRRALRRAHRLIATTGWRHDQRTVDALGRLWAETWDHGLGTALVDERTPLPGWHDERDACARVGVVTLRAAAQGWPARTEPADGSVADPLAQVPPSCVLAALYPDRQPEQIAVVFREALRRLTRPDLVEQLCADAVLGKESAVAAVLDAGYLPAGAADRAMLLAMTGQWDRYAALDPDGRLIAAGYAVADRSVRYRARQAARVSAQVDLTVMVLGPEETPRLPIDDDEVTSLVDSLLAGDDRDERIGPLLHRLTPPAAVHAVLRLTAAGWTRASPSDGRILRAFHDVTPDTLTNLRGLSSQPFAPAPGGLRNAADPAVRRLLLDQDPAAGPPDQDPGMASLVTPDGTRITVRSQAGRRRASGTGNAHTSGSWAIQELDQDGVETLIVELDDAHQNLIASTADHYFASSAGPAGIALSSDGACLAVTVENVCLVLDRVSGRVTHAWEVGPHRGLVAFAPGDRDVLVPVNPSRYFAYADYGAGYHQKRCPPDKGVDESYSDYSHRLRQTDYLGAVRYYRIGNTDGTAGAGGFFECLRHADEVVALTSPPGQDTVLAIQRSGRLSVIGFEPDPDPGYLLVARVGQASQMTLTAAHALRDAVISADGATVAALDTDGRITTWDTALPGALRRPLGDLGAADFALFQAYLQDWPDALPRDIQSALAACAELIRDWPAP